MTKLDIKKIILNSYCCIANKANELSDLLSKGNRCSDKELEDLKLIIDKINALSQYFCTLENLENSDVIIDNLGLRVKQINKLSSDISNYCKLCKSCLELEEEI